MFDLRQRLKLKKYRFLIFFKGYKYQYQIGCLLVIIKQSHYSQIKKGLQQMNVIRMTMLHQIYKLICQKKQALQKARTLFEQKWMKERIIQNNKRNLRVYGNQLNNKNFKIEHEMESMSILIVEIR
ncbi:unnamed protein product [Paramecium octaurelia]|uniref:Uncharacterized protein n=1 Tax=Paramecium octaurelia TaxID=43137 RepID=A0A8S1U225_PAROT|nr:unnamed protein product [Paramecium octaurelia]